MISIRVIFYHVLILLLLNIEQSTIHPGLATTGYVPRYDMITYVTSFMPQYDPSSGIDTLSVFLTNLYGRCILYTTDNYISSIQNINDAIIPQRTSCLVANHTRAAYQEVLSTCTQSNASLIMINLNSTTGSFPTNLNTKIPDFTEMFELGHLNPWLLYNAVYQGLFADSTLFFYINITAFPASPYAYANWPTTTSPYAALFPVEGVPYEFPSVWPDIDVLRQIYDANLDHFPFQLLMQQVGPALSEELCPLTRNQDGLATVIGTDFFGGSKYAATWFAQTYYNLMNIWTNLMPGSDDLMAYISCNYPNSVYLLVAQEYSNCTTSQQLVDYFMPSVFSNCNTSSTISSSKKVSDLAWSVILGYTDSEDL